MRQPTAFCKLVELARQCPRDYGHSFSDFERNDDVQRLADALRRFGYECLSRAVSQGISWSRRIGQSTEERELGWLEGEASALGWSWNQPLEETV